MCVREVRGTTIFDFLSSVRSVRSISYLSCWRRILSTTGFSMAHTLLSTKGRSFFSLILNSASSFSLIDKQCLLILIINVAQIFFLFLDIIAESEGDKIISSSILPVPDDLVFFHTISKHYKWIMLLGPSSINVSSHIKTLEIITRTVDFGIPTIKIFLNKK